MHEFGDAQNLVGLHPHLRADAREPAGTSFQIGDADGVFVAHPQREVARGFAKQCAVEMQTIETVAVELGVGRILVVRQAAYAFLDDGGGFG